MLNVLHSIPMSQGIEDIAKCVQTDKMLTVQSIHTR